MLPKAKTAVPLSPLARFTASIKATDKAKRNPAEALLHIIDEYTLSQQFDEYMTRHAADLVRYLKPERTRPGRWRASAAGKCLQSQAFTTAEKLKPGRFKRSLIPQQRNANTYRALANGTFTHIRWHFVFDALHEAGTVRTIVAEDLRVVENQRVSGTVDRVIEFDYGGEVIRAIIDFKSMKSTYFDPLVEPAPDHVLQVSSYALFSYGAKWYMLLYECKNTHKLKIYARKFDELVVAQVVENLRKLNNWTDLVLEGAIDDQLPRLPLITDWCRFCEWTEDCKKLNPQRDAKAVH